MSRTAKRNAARLRLYILLGATAAVTVAALAILFVQLAGNHEDPDPNGSISGNSDTNPLIISSTDTDTSTQSVTDSAATDSETDSAPDTETDNTSAPSVTDNLPAGNSDYKTDDPTPGVNDDGSFDFSAWNMILVNPDHPIPDNYPQKLAWLSLNGRDRQVNSLCVDAFREMVNAAKEDGIILLLRSTYRGIALQTESFNNKVQEYVNKGYSKDEATKLAATIVAVPGTSEHHTGLAADITTPSYDRLNAGFENTDAFKWLVTHCAEYGFILRYPKDKTEITKIIYEPWHYRYVGKEAAQIIMSEGICYEEFVEKYGSNAE